MVNQKPISLKIDHELLEMLDKEVTCGFRKRNWHINEAIRIYLELQDCRRMYKCVGSDQEKKNELNIWLRHRFPEAASW